MQLSRRGDYGVRVILDLASQPPAHPFPPMRSPGDNKSPPPSWGRSSPSWRLPGWWIRDAEHAGGVTLARSPEQITLLEVVEALEGKITLNPCLIRAGACPLDQTCPVHDTWAEAQRALKAVLAKTTFAQLAAHNGRNGHATF